jgi:SAM-dependent methyltransferase
MVTTIRIELDPPRAFGVFVDDLSSGLARLGSLLEARPKGRVMRGTDEVGRVEAWQPNERILLSWQLTTWEPQKSSSIEILFRPIEGGTEVSVEHRGFDGVLSVIDTLGWFAAETIAPFLRATAPDAIGDWITDRRARRPFGAEARDIYRDPLYHYPNFRVILNELNLKPDDYLLEVGCGGGAFLKKALMSGCRAAAVDHSADMVHLAKEVNSGAIAAGKLEIVESPAERLPFSNNTFSCAVMTGVFGFLQDPHGALCELHRVLVEGGRLVLLGSDPAMRGTPAAPEPMASRLHFYDDREFELLGRSAGFDSVRVVRRDMESYAKDAGVPEEQLVLFKGPGGPFMIAHK